MRRVTVSVENHVACFEVENYVGMGGGVVEELADFSHCVFGRGGLLHGEGTKGHEYRHVDGTSVINVDANDSLDNVLVCLAEDEGIVFVL